MSTAHYSGRVALNRALDRSLRADYRVLLFGRDLADPVGGRYGVTKGLSTAHGLHRVVDTPEPAIIGAAVGAAIEGMLPVVEIPASGITNAVLDQLQAVLGCERPAKTGAPVLRVPLPPGESRSRAYGQWFARVPGLKVLAPSTPADAEALLSAAITDPAPCIVLEPAVLYRASGPRAEPARTAAHRCAAETVRRGTDATVVTYGAIRGPALRAAAALAAEGIDVDVVDLRSLAPLDVDTVLAAVRRTRRLVLAPDMAAPSGPPTEIAAVIHRELFGTLHAPIEYVVGPADTDGPNASEIVAAVRATCGRVTARRRVISSAPRGPRAAPRSRTRLAASGTDSLSVSEDG
ncbi:alpha-ketoacid dehydrogenase subunit beta [Saccharopolyspora sp. HNM0983]|uniref:Alpha-ketoacid dehydrogenase subunit beta n=1 Tax=Saccharopolyspora montiporae TaxID=2781240 RepID=A0A929FW84_9PSEU|nr:transketolase C-terminal domain-containing protein [Saccharopolyspora sp. HNM0983]MBE9373266.1 alpha-ketoacid dehydrogenase subunit beta [Saccharopolyspora sp. HNM0983]